jgi:O-antigen/teichoic acid export membrane protein
MAARIVEMAFALVYLRILGPANTGAYQFLVVFTTYLDTLVDFGLNTVVARDARRTSAPLPAVFRAVAGLRLGLWLIGLPLALLVYGPGLEVAGLPPEARAAGVVYFIALLPAIVAKTASGLLWSLERLELTAMVSVVATLLRVGLGALVLFLGLGLLGLASTSLLVNLVSATSLTLLVVRQEHWRRLAEGVGHTVTRLDGLMRESWPLFVNQLLQGLFFKVDGILMPGLAGASAAGAYAAAYKVPEGTGVISSNVTLALFPRLAAEAARPTEGLARAYRLTLRSLLQVALPLAAGGAILAEAIVTIVGGRSYLPDSAVALAILMWFVPFSYANGLIQYVLIAVGRQRLLTLAFLVAAVFNVLANLILIPRFGFVGAAWVTVVSEVVLLVPFGWAVARSVPGVLLLHEARSPILATLIMAPVVWWLRDALNPALALLAGLLVYPAALWAVGGIAKDQLEVAQRLFKS